MPRARYPPDLTDAEWAVLAPLIPPPKVGGRPPTHERRELVNAMRYVLRGGIAWRSRPHDLPRGKRCTTISASGALMAPGNRPTPRCVNRCECGPVGRLRRRPPFSTVSRPGRPNNGGPRLRWRQEAEWSEAASPRGYRRIGAGCGGAPRQCG